jgi:hypothetical protein
MDVHLMSEQREINIIKNKEQEELTRLLYSLRREILKFTTPVNHLSTFNSTANEYLKMTLK